MKHEAEQLPLFPPPVQLEFWSCELGDLVKIKCRPRGTFPQVYRVISPDLYRALMWSSGYSEDYIIADRYNDQAMACLLIMTRDPDDLLNESFRRELKSEITPADIS